MKQIFTFVLWGLLVTLVSCHGEPTFEKTVITWMVSVGADRPMYEQFMQTFNREHPTIEVKPVWVPGTQYQLKLKTLIAAGQAPDIFWSSDVWLAYELPFPADLTSFVKRDATETNLDDFYPELLAAGRYDRRQILLPRWFNISLLYYDRKLFDDAHEPYPSADWTWDDYIAAAQRLTRRDASGGVQVWGSGITTGWWSEWLIYVRQAGGEMFSDDMNHCLLDSPEAIQGMQFYLDKIYRYRVAPRPGFGPATGFLSGKIAMELGGHTINWNNYNHVEDLDWDIQILPKGPKTRRGGEFAIDTFGVSKDSKHLEESWQFIKFLVSRPCIRENVRNGYLPVRRSVAQEMLFDHPQLAHPRNVGAVYEQLKYAQLLSRSPDFLEIAMEVIQPDVDRARSALDSRQSQMGELP